MAARKKASRVVYKYHERPDAYDKEWHLDRKVPIALIIAMIGQIILGVSWATTLRNDVSMVKEDLTAVKSELKSSREKWDGLSDLRGEIKALVQSVSRLERYIDAQQFKEKK